MKRSETIQKELKNLGIDVDYAFIELNDNKLIVLLLIEILKELKKPSFG